MEVLLFYSYLIKIYVNNLIVNFLVKPMENKYGIMSIILGLIGFIFTLFIQSLLFSLFGIIFAIVALIFGVLGVMNNASRGISIIGILIGIVDIISWIIIFLLIPEYFGVL